MNGESLAARNEGATSVSWVATGVGEGYVVSPDIANILQVRAGEEGWSLGDPMVIIAKPTGAGAFMIRSYNTSPSRLNATYTVAAAGGIPPHLLFNTAHGGL